MFGTKTPQSDGYKFGHKAGTNYLRSQVITNVYAEDSLIVEKLVQYQLHWEFYKNRHWADNNDKLLSFNYVRAIIDKVNNFILGKSGFEQTIVDLYGDDVEEDIEKAIELWLNYNWEMNKKMVLLGKVMQMGSICGDAYVFLSADVEGGYIKYTLIDSRSIVPIFNKGDRTDVIGYKVIKKLGTNDEKYITKVTEYTKGQVETYFLKSTEENSTKFEHKVTKNELNYIPIVHIENIPMSDGYGGASDVIDVVKLNKVYNELAEDIKEIVDYYAAPTTVITGGTVGQLKRGVGELWSGLPSDANVFNLTLNEDLGSSNAFASLIKNAIHDLSGVPEEVLSKVQHISNTSAAALQMLYQPMIQVADKKCISYGEGITEINRITNIMGTQFLRDHPMIAKLPQESYDNPEAYFKRYQAKPVFKYNLPNDKMGLLQEAQLEISMNLNSRRNIMEKHGTKNIPKVLAQIDEDIKKYGASEEPQTSDPKTKKE